MLPHAYIIHVKYGGFQLTTQLKFQIINTLGLLSLLRLIEIINKNVRIIIQKTHHCQKNKNWKPKSTNYCNINNSKTQQFWKNLHNFANLNNAREFCHWKLTRFKFVFLSRLARTRAFLDWIIQIVIRFTHKLCVW